MILTRETAGGRWRIRPDGPGKVTGRLKYLTDLALPGMLHGVVLRSAHPHARIRAIRTERAAALPGVRAVLTHRDVPGLNAFGISRQDQPVFCSDRVRYVGDAVAAVAADTPEIAERALGLIEVDYEPLPVLDTPEKALSPDALKLHPHGNVLHRSEYRRGDVDAAFAECVHVVEETYVTPRQMHTYLETEGGLFVPEPDGRLTVYAPTQHGLLDRLQLARILGVPEEAIRVVSSPIGGSFGGKDELNIQPYGALLARATGRPVKIHHSRRESVRAGLKRHPMRITMKTGIDASGRLLAHRVRIVADTGPYATLGAEVLNFATEHVIGPYRYANLDVEGVSVYTNNGMSGEFRGFGGNQAIFALEGQMDRLAELAGIDPWEFRLINLRRMGDPGPFGQQIAQTDGAYQVWVKLKESPLWRERDSLKRAGEASASAQSGGAARPPWIRTGIGAAMVMHGFGLGYGIPDPAAGRLRLAEDGRIEAIFGYEEFGQGLFAAIEALMIDTFGIGPDDLRIVVGDTDRVPDSGSSTASRTTAMIWQALRRMEQPFRRKLLEAAARLTGRAAGGLTLAPGGVADAESGVLLIRYADLAAKAEETIGAQVHFHFPTTDLERIGAHFLYSYAAVAVKVEVNLLTGRVRVLDQYHAVAAGPVVNPMGYVGQIEGGSGMALGFALLEDAVMENGHYLTGNLDTYLIPTIADSRGTVAVEPVEELPEGDPYGPRGIGEIGSVGLAPAIAEAIHEATGVRVSRLPVDPALLIRRPEDLWKAVDGR
ncbi:MAG: xanthine dehydrogenase subunit D [Thermobacillus sp. ZCTH02-B1]|uniref:xanthine dehydrogenase subunit D n=1 Tax=Thermobacillus sp. ZCTH02-B1 TaxID=1858795 RepID=UPI000B56257C|nr:xanthine dehydrogenase subunit D [Thermobacillus sp. ZCTH02-B1]OUM96596.1 MAG: xanthine dehydrogenase subunit D [Thermobacillus sp. ZCTH02-B1]